MTRSQPHPKLSARDAAAAGACSPYSGSSADFFSVTKPSVVAMRWLSRACLGHRYLIGSGRARRFKQSPIVTVGWRSAEAIAPNLWEQQTSSTRSLVVSHFSHTQLRIACTCSQADPRTLALHDAQTGRGTRRLPPDVHAAHSRSAEGPLLHSSGSGRAPPSFMA